MPFLYRVVVEFIAKGRAAQRSAVEGHTVRIRSRCPARIQFRANYVGRVGS